MDDDDRARARVGTILDDKWTLERLLGLGGMAAVYAGLHRNGARAAIKILHPSLARREDVKERFMREGYAANRVNHSGVVKVLDDDVIASGADEGGAYLVMELLEGQSIEERVEKGPPILERELLGILRAVLDVLATAHDAGVIHRDLKPENLFLARDPLRIKILDFGLARIAEGTSKTLAGIAIGTPSYMPPEQAAGRVQDVDARSDLFALGASCFRILADRTVHPGRTAFDICARMASEPAPKLRTVAPDVSEATAAVIDRALEFRREDRFANATEMRKAVDAAIADIGGDVVQIDSGMIELIEDAPAKEPPPLPTEKEKRGGGGCVLWLALLALAGVGVALALDRNLLSALVKDQASPEAAAPTSSIVALPIASHVEVVATPVVDAEPDVSSDLVDATPELSHDAAVTTSTLDAGRGDAGHHKHHDAGAHPHPHHRRE